MINLDTAVALAILAFALGGAPACTSNDASSSDTPTETRDASKDSSLNDARNEAGEAEEAGERIDGIDPAQDQSLIAKDGSGLAFKGGTLVTASGAAPAGPISAELKSILSSSSSLLDMPGSFHGLDSAGQDEALISFGVVRVELTDADGTALNLKPGATATITVPALALGPVTVPLWSLNESTDIWEELGIASLNGEVYVGTVSHLSYWNVDVLCNRACITGTVAGATGMKPPTVFARVENTTCSGVAGGLGRLAGLGGLAGGYAPVDSSGHFEIQWLPGSSVIALSTSGCSTSTTVTVPGSGSSCVDVGTISACPDDAGVDAGVDADGGDCTARCSGGGAGDTYMCGCSGTCNGIDYSMSCAGTTPAASCTCLVNGVTRTPSTDCLTPEVVTATFKSECGFPGH